MRFRLINSNKGFTLIEVIISIMIFSVVGILLTHIMGQGATVLRSIFVSEEIRDNLYLAQRRFNQDLMNLRDVVHIRFADKKTFRIIDSYLDTIQYSYSNGKLYRNINNSGDYAIAQYLTDSTRFYYYSFHDAIFDEYTLGDTTLLKIWRVRLDLYGAKDNHTMKIETLSFPQNFKYGLVKEF